MRRILAAVALVVAGSSCVFAGSATAEENTLTTLWGPPVACRPESEHPAERRVCWRWPGRGRVGLSIQGEVAVSVEFDRNDDLAPWTDDEIAHLLKLLGWDFGRRLGIVQDRIITGPRREQAVFERGELFYAADSSTVTDAGPCTACRYLYAICRPLEIREGVVERIVVESGTAMTTDFGMEHADWDRRAFLAGGRDVRLAPEDAVSVGQRVRYAVMRSGTVHGLWPPVDMVPADSPAEVGTATPEEDALTALWGRPRVFGLTIQAESGPLGGDFPHDRLVQWTLPHGGRAFLSIQGDVAIELDYERGNARGWNEHDIARVLEALGWDFGRRLGTVENLFFTVPRTEEVVFERGALTSEEFTITLRPLRIYEGLIQGVVEMSDSRTTLGVLLHEKPERRAVVAGRYHVSLSRHDEVTNRQWVRYALTRADSFYGLWPPARMVPDSHPAP